LFIGLKKEKGGNKAALFYPALLFSGERGGRRAQKNESGQSRSFLAQGRRRGESRYPCRTFLSQSGRKRRPTLERREGLGPLRHFTREQSQKKSLILLLSTY